MSLITQSKTAYCLVQLENLLKFTSESQGLKEITTWKKKRKNYYTGQFKNIAGDIYLYEYAETKKASDSRREDFLVSIDDVDMLHIFPDAVIPVRIQLDVRIYCVSQSDLDHNREEGLKEGLKEGLN